MVSGAVVSAVPGTVKLPEPPGVGVGAGESVPVVVSSGGVVPPASSPSIVTLLITVPFQGQAHAVAISEMFSQS